MIVTVIAEVLGRSDQLLVNAKAARFKGIYRTIFFTPVFYVICRWLAERMRSRSTDHAAAPQPAE